MKFFAVRCFFVAGATVLFPFGHALAQSGVAAPGEQIALTWCSNCHLVGRDANSARDSVPAFAAIAKMTSTTSMSLHSFLQTSHGPMPDFALTQPQIDDIVAYILSLRPQNG